MKMDLLLFVYFVALSENLNFSITAEELYLSQSSLSKRIKILEENIGVELFERNTRSINLTEAGETLLPYAKNIASEYGNLQKIMNQLNQDNKKLTIAVISFMSQYRIIQIVTSFEYENKGVKLEVIEEDSRKEIDLLDKGYVDACIMYSNIISKEKYNIYPLIKDRLVLVVNNKHFLSDLTTILLKDIKNEYLLLLSKNNVPFLYEYIISECKKAGFNPLIRNNDVWLPSIESMIIEDNFISVLPRKVAQHFDSTKISIIEITHTEGFWLSIVSKKDNSSTLLSNFVKHAMSIVDEIE